MLDGQSRQFGILQGKHCDVEIDVTVNTVSELHTEQFVNVEHYRQFSEHLPHMPVVEFIR